MAWFIAAVFLKGASTMLKILMRATACTVLLAVVSTTISACSTTYGAMGAMGGVAAAPITSDTYRISAQGNGYTDATTIQDYAFLKAAETTLAAGKTHFTIVGDRDATSSTTQSTGGSFSSFGGSIFYNPGINYNVVKPGQDLLIHVWSPSPKETLPPNTFKAQEVFDNINPRVKRSK